MTSAPVAAAIIAAAAALVGYVANQAAGRRERRAAFYAEALRAVKGFEELPYRIAKRKDASGETRERVGNMVNDAFVELSFYRAWLGINSPQVAVCYHILANRAEELGGSQQLHAWENPLPEDAHGEMGKLYFYGTHDELAACVDAMRRDLSLTLRLVHRLRKR